MKEYINNTVLTMQTATSQQLERNFGSNFSVKYNLPENLKILDTISQNFYWFWTPGGMSIFRDLDYRLWEKCEQNPRRMLCEVSELRLWQKANEPAFVARVNRFAEKMGKYLDEPPKTFGKITTENPVAYFCAEYGVHNSLPIYSGGLGILAGDHLKSASDMNVPLIAIGLFYRFGYFRQKIAHDGWQEERYIDSFQNQLAINPVFDADGNRVEVSVHIRGREVTAQAWLAKIGRISLYLLDTNVPQNEEVDRLITGHLYGGDTETRIVQEKVLGMGGVRLLRALGIEPSVYHLNEGHSAFLTLELAKEYLDANETATFADAIPHIREKCVFTTHTPVSAGNDAFQPDLLLSCFKESFAASLKLSKEEFLGLGRVDSDDHSEFFGMTPLAIRMCRSSNGVSEKHGEVSRELWQEMFAGKSVEEVPITHITNGVHSLTWVASDYNHLYEKKIGDDWTEILKDEKAWAEAVNKLSDEEIWDAHFNLKNRLIAFMRQRAYTTETGDSNTVPEHSSFKNLFNPNILTIGFARRVAGYKRWNLLMKDGERLLKLIDNIERPVQFIFAGKAHPQDRNAKAILQNLVNLKGNSTWFQRAVFLEDYDQEIARYMVQGVDVWMNVPRRPLEASGTSGQKAAMNGGLNFSVLDGWWIEGYDEVNGFAIGPLRDEPGVDDATIDDQDAEALYQVLENEIVPTYYAKGENGLPTQWIARMRRALQTLTPKFSSDRMLKDYVEKIYS
ncbi:MAG: alpha-glucan family phosphorylase [Acidobacteriota bacterium]